MQYPMCVFMQLLTRLAFRTHEFRSNFFAEDWKFVVSMFLKAFRPRMTCVVTSFWNLTRRQRQLPIYLADQLMRCAEVGARCLPLHARFGAVHARDAAPSPAQGTCARQVRRARYTTRCCAKFGAGYMYTPSSARHTTAVVAQCSDARALTELNRRGHR